MALEIHAHGRFSLSNGNAFGKNVIIFGVDLSSTAHVDNRKKYILIFCKGLMQGLEDTIFTAEEEYVINFSEQRKKFCLSLHYNRVDSYLFVNGVEMYKFNAKDSEINEAQLCLGNVSKDFSADNMKKTGFYGYVYDFSVDYDSTDAVDILYIHKQLMAKNNIK